MTVNETGTITLKLLVQDLASGKIGQFVGGLDKLAQKGGLVGSVAQGVGQSFGQLLNPVGLVSSALGVVADQAGKAIDAASDLNESLSKSQVVFGDNADAIEDWADTAAQSMGLSKQAALETAGTFGNLFDALGLTDDAMRDMSTGAAQLAGDLASFNNADLGETLAAIQSGLVGETEPMRRFGSNLSAARVEAYALAQGWVKNKKELTEALKVQARFELMLKDTKNAAGDYARTADGLANSQRTLNAEIDNLYASIGQDILPIAAEFGKMLKSTILPAVKDTIKTLKDAKDSGLLDALFGVLTGNQLAIAQAGAKAGESFIRGSAKGVKKYTPELLNEIRSVNDEIEDEQATRLSMLVKVWNDFPSMLTGSGLTEALDVFIDNMSLDDKAALLGRQIPESLRGALEASLPGLETSMRTSGTKAGESFADGLKSARDETAAAVRALKWAIAHPFDEEKEKQKARGILLGTELAAGIKKSRNDPRVRERTQALIDATIDRLNVLKGEGYDVGYEMSLALSAALEANPWVQLFRKNAKNNKSDVIAGLSLYDLIETSDRKPRGKPKKHAMGLDYVPYDDYPALLHEGERVLTKAENARGTGMTFVYAPQYSTASPAEAQRFVSSILPEIQRAMGRSF